MDEDLDRLSREQLIDEVKKLRRGEQAPHAPRTKQPYEATGGD
jgi:hypothetical protein